MSELRRAVRRTIAGVAGLFAVAAFVPHASAAQSAAQYRARLSATLRARKVAMDSLDTLRTRRAQDLPPDSLVSGVVRVRYSKLNLGPDLEATLRAAVQHAGALADTQFGDARLDGPDAVIVVNRVQRGQVSSLSFDVLQIELPGPSGRNTSIRAPVTQRKLSDEMLDMIGTLATDGVPLDLSRWAGYWAPSHPLTPDDWEAAALDLATSSSSVSRTCYSGSISRMRSGARTRGGTRPARRVVHARRLARARQHLGSTGRRPWAHGRPRGLRREESLGDVQASRADATDPRSSQHEHALDAVQSRDRARRPVVVHAIAERDGIAARGAVGRSRRLARSARG